MFPQQPNHVTTATDTNTTTEELLEVVFSVGFVQGYVRRAKWGFKPDKQTNQK
jgi:hypothetical protein